MNLSWLDNREKYERIPRVSGDEPEKGTGKTTDTEYSPRERG